MLESGANNIDIYDRGLFFKGRHLDVFLEKAEFLKIEIKDEEFLFSGNDSEINKFANELTKITFWKVKDFARILNNPSTIGATSKLINYFNELNNKALKIDYEIYKKFPELKKIILDKFLSALIFSGTKNPVELENTMVYFYNNYIKNDYKNYKCQERSYSFPIIEYLAKKNDKLKLNLETYPIIDEDNLPEYTKFMAPLCQKIFFENKYEYLKSIKSKDTIKYELILTEKFGKLSN